MLDRPRLQGTRGQWSEQFDGKSTAQVPSQRGRFQLPTVDDEQPDRQLEHELAQIQKAHIGPKSERP